MKILILGQTPPPHGGQAINIEKMLGVLGRHSFDHHFIRLNFSDEINDMGYFSIKKGVRLAIIFIRLLGQLLFYRPDIVYYPPAGPVRTAIFRDMILLSPVRFFGFTTVFHYHAGGLSGTYRNFSGLLRAIFRFAYFNADYSICLSEQGKKDPVFLRSKKIHVIASGAEDTGYTPDKNNQAGFTVLFAGLCSESKGIFDFIEIIRLCNKSNPYIHGKILGKPFSSKESISIQEAVKEGLITYEGVQTGEPKNSHFRDASVFLFPSFFESENFPTVVIESFSAGLPVVASRWRGIVDQVVPGHNGFLHEVHDIEGMSSSILKLAADRPLYQALSANARRDFETKFTIGIFEQSIVSVFNSFR